MKKITTAFVLLLVFATIKSSGQKTIETADKVYDFADKMPEPGYDILQYLADNIRYPDSAIYKNIEGRVIVKFVISEDGFITDCKVVKGIGWGCDEEALRIIKDMPPWKPGLNNGKAVKVYFNQPITFKLEEPDSAMQAVEVFRTVDTFPVPKYSMTSYLERTLRYPEKARDNGLQGRVIVTFIVSDKGVICNAEVASGAGSSELDKEALRVVRNMPPWKPAIKDGKPVNCWSNQPIFFKLE